MFRKLNINVLLIVAVLLIVIVPRLDQLSETEAPTAGVSTEEASAVSPRFVDKLLVFLENCVFSLLRVLMTFAAAWFLLMFIDSITPKYNIWEGVKNGQQAIAILVGCIVIAVSIAVGFAFL